MAVHDALNRGQTDPGPRKLAGIMKPLKGTKKLVGVAHVEAGTVVAHPDHALPIPLLATELDMTRVSV